MNESVETVPSLEWPPSAPPPPHPRPAGFWRRGGALVLDYIFLALVVAAAEVATSLLWGEPGRTSRVLNAASTAFRWMLPPLYTVLFHWLWGQTMGKMVVGARVVAVGGGPLSLERAFGRAVAWLVSALPFGAGFVVAAVRRDRRALHDLLAGTRVERV
jgi:uncharacterized RDD family membrane protein YckC